MQVPLKRKKVGDVFYYIPILLEKNQESIDLVDELINMHKLAIGKNIQNLLDDNGLIEKFSDIRVYRGIITVLLKYFFIYETRTPISTVDPESVRMKLYTLMLENRKSFFLPQDRDTIYTELSKRTILTTEQIKNTIFADHAIFKTVKLNENVSADLNPEIVIKHYNTELLYSLFRKCHFLEFTIALENLRGTFVKEFVYSTKHLGIYVDFQNTGKNVIIKALGPLELVGKSTKYGRQLFLLFVHYYTYFSSLNIQIRLEISYFEEKRNILLDIAHFPPINLFLNTEKNLFEENKFDSKIEEKFNDMFRVLGKGWQIEREPVIIEEGIIMIPDFELCYQNKVKIFLEIVGFWTERYLNHKVRKVQLLENKYPNMILWIDEKLNFPEVNLKTFKYGKTLPSLEFITYLKQTYQLPVMNEQVVKLLENKSILMAKIEALCLQKRYIHIEQLVQEFPELGDEEQFKILVERGFISNITPLPAIIYAKNSMILFSLPLLVNLSEKLQEKRKEKSIWDAEELQKVFHNDDLPSKELRICWKLLGCKWTMKNLLLEQITLPERSSLNNNSDRIIAI